MREKGQFYDVSFPIQEHYSNAFFVPQKHFNAFSTFFVMFIPRFLFFYLFVVLLFSFYLEQVVINSRYLNDKFSFSVPSLTSSLLTLRFFWTISFSPKTSVSIWQLMPLILSSLTCSLSQELLIYICGEHPMGMLYPASFEIKFLILLPKPALALYSNPSG